MLNKFSSPFGEGFYRALLQTGATFVVGTFGTFLGMQAANIARGERWEISLMTGAISALGPFAVGTAIARSDQLRAENDVVKPADVPVAAVNQRK